jgi:hypothetical protein
MRAVSSGHGKRPIDVVVERSEPCAADLAAPAQLADPTA